MNTKLLVPTDFSEVAQSAMQHAIKFAEIINADLILLHIVNSREEVEEAKEKLRKEITLGSSFSQSGGHYSTTLYGSSINDIVMVDNGWVSTITMGEGDDVVHAKDADAPDDIDMGAGDDFLIINSDANDTSLDGGTGSDWIAFRTVNWGASSAKNYTINSGNASNQLSSLHLSHLSNSLIVLGNSLVRSVVFIKFNNPLALSTY